MLQRRFLRNIQPFYLPLLSLFRQAPPPATHVVVASSLASLLGPSPRSSLCSFSSCADAQFSDGGETSFRPHPFNRRFAFSDKPVFPIEPRNLRSPGVKRMKKRRGRGQKNCARGTMRNIKSAAETRWSEGGQTPLYRRLPKWPEAYLSRQRRRMEPLNLCKLRKFIERGQVDSRFPITQRHLHDSRCIKVRNGVRLFNVNDYPFPYKIDLEVAGSDQSSIDAICRVGGSVTIVYYDRIGLRAHIKPYKFEVLPKTARPNLEMVHYLEKMRARGCVVRYIQPQWLVDEEKRLRTELYEYEAEHAIAEGAPLTKTVESASAALSQVSKKERTEVRQQLVRPSYRMARRIEKERLTEMTRNIS
eukprot:GHVS01043692.1.p1 GENE.GHVS01043692.1~~GHVS01043692.1.p1  ORF type:complete len:361 (+),score=33.67 GHVS01043692.1:3-1085(+)